MLGDAKRIGIIGCSSCATACATGGEKEIQQLKAYLESQGPHGGRHRRCRILAA